MDKPILAVFDSEERYAHGFMEFVSNKADLPFQIHVFTEKDKFFAYSQKEEIECLLLSENVYEGDVEALNIPHVIILSESGECLNRSMLHINKYQSCEAIWKELMAYYLKETSHINSQTRTNLHHMKIIGIYTPVKRCLQTTFAFTLGQLLAKDAKVLYLNFEKFSGLSVMLKKSFQDDLSDLMYYFQCAREKFSLRLSSIVENSNGLDYVPPAEIYQNLCGIRGQQWLELFQEIERSSNYDYLILDLADGVLTDGVMDLWDVLRSCSLVYTITKGDGLAAAKVLQYEKVLKMMDYEDVLAKTKRLQFPVFRQLPVRFDELTYGDLARYLKEHVLPEILRQQEDENE